MAAHLGIPVGELLFRVSSRELSEWAAYERVYGPLGPSRHDMYAALIAATVHNTTPGVKRAKKLRDFVIEWDRPRQQSWQEQLVFVKTIHRALGGD